MVQNVGARADDWLPSVHVKQIMIELQLTNLVKIESTDPGLTDCRAAARSTVVAMEQRGCFATDGD